MDKSIFHNLLYFSGIVSVERVNRFCNKIHGDRMEFKIKINYA